MSNRKFEESARLYQRALATIPLASQTFSKSAINLVEGASPLFLERGEGCRVWDVDGNCYIDYVLGLMPAILGYRDPDVDSAIRSQLERGITFSLATALEVELAERLVRLIPCAEMVRFGKNGSDATAAAVRLARAATARDLVAVCGYHGWQDWYIGSTSRHLGVPDAVRELTRTFTYNDAGSLAAMLESDPGCYAAVVLEPAGVVEPAPGFLREVRELCDAHGVVLVFDEIVTGFRIALGGAQAYYGVSPDLACFGKAMGNGMPISAVVGSTELMRQMGDIFYSTTFGGETLSLAAAIATIDKLERTDTTTRLTALGARIAEMTRGCLRAHGLDSRFTIEGPDWWPRVKLLDPAPATSAVATSLLRQELIANGILMGGGFNLCLAHDDESVIAETLEAWDRACSAVAVAFNDPAPARYLRGKPIRPIFQVRD